MGHTYFFTVVFIKTKSIFFFFCSYMGKYLVKICNIYIQNPISQDVLRICHHFVHLPLFSLNGDWNLFGKFIHFVCVYAKRYAIAITILCVSFGCKWNTYCRGNQAHSSSIHVCRISIVSLLFVYMVWWVYNLMFCCLYTHDVGYILLHKREVMLLVAACRRSKKNPLKISLVWFELDRLSDVTFKRSMVILKISSLVFLVLKKKKIKPFSTHLNNVISYVCCTHAHHIQDKKIDAGEKNANEMCVCVMARK